MPIWRMWRTGPNASGLDRVDQRAHPRVEAGGAGDALGRPLPALGAMLGGAALGRVDDLAGEHRVAPRGEAGLAGEREEALEQGAAQMGPGEIEADAAFLDDQAREPVGLGREQVVERRRAAPSRLVQASLVMPGLSRASGHESLARP